MSKKPVTIKPSTGFLFFTMVGLGGLTASIVLTKFVLRPFIDDRRKKEAFKFAEALMEMEAEMARNIRDEGSASTEVENH